MPSGEEIYDDRRTISRTDGYRLSLRRRGHARCDLVVVLSPAARFALYRHDFGRDALFVADLKTRYFVPGAGGLAAAILRIVDDGGYRRVLFTGASKAGFGALLVARLCARSRPGRVFHAVAFSPQIRLYPENPNLVFSSYRRLLQSAETNAFVDRTLKRHGDLSQIGAVPNLVSLIIHARDCAEDRAEAERVVGPNARLRLVEGSFHGTLFYFLSRGLDRANVAARIERAYAREDDEDLARTRPEDLDRMVDEVFAAASREPMLNELIDAVLDRSPAPIGLLDRIRWRLRLGAPPPAAYEIAAVSASQS